jgi:hypothetical protein
MLEMVSLLLGEAKGRRDGIGITFTPPDNAGIRFAQPCRRLDQRIEHLRQIKRRPTNDFEDFGGGRLLLKRLVTLTGTAVELFLQVSGYLCGRRFAYLGLPLNLLPASTASLHVARLRRFTTMLNPRQS